jgi:hypothetical protein
MAKTWKRWTAKDVKTLERYAGILPVPSLVIKLKRSEHSVRAKAKLLGINLTTARPVWFRAKDLAIALDISPVTVRSWVRRGELSAWRVAGGDYYFSLYAIQAFYRQHHRAKRCLSEIGWDGLLGRLIDR